MRTARLALVACCCLLLGVAATTAVVSAPPPSQLCGVCGLEDGVPANDAGIPGATDPGTLDIYVDEEGDSLWHARVPVDATTAQRYRANETALEAAVDDAWTRYHAADGDIRTVEPTMDGDTVVVNYTVDGIARRGVGDSWLLDYFVDDRTPTRYEQVAEGVTIHAPAGTAVTNSPADADVEGNRATWTQNGTGSGASARGFDADTYVTYGEDSALGTASGYATIALEFGPPALRRGLLVGVAPSVLIGAVGVAAGRLERGRAIDTATLERAIVGVGGVGAVGILLVGALTTTRWLPPPAVALASLGFGYALVGRAARRAADRLGTRGVTGLAVLATVAAVALASLLAGPPPYPFPTLFGLATALFLPIGYGFERDRTPVGLLAIVSLVPVVAAAVAVPAVRLGSGLVLLVAVFQLLTWVAVVAGFGYPLALLGRRLAES